ncbi:NAD(P)/FAD-dependent oxidoreductase [Ramlibacter sp. AW1]|uniref:NAD(P)/FAD-dependent oxidoreductase n=1 Tax=Ramlibacter aurantiacus TaxID=2801330 RepID=A0A936ZDW1_9BURK|nr:NAD(P)/FAD-dependent oxidoreductase [Ramlibacter aurantiacus]MBL0419142.1 NAD(P)/FAD-dependent oxidoreductase [Ramlibacter aurantiacus]
MTQRFDVVIIGTGTAATVAAGRLSSAGRSVAVVDWRPYGGTCVLRGCDPKKMLLAGAAAVDHVRRMHGHGVTGDSRLAWAELMRFKRGFTDPVPAAREKRFADQGVARFHGRARFTGPDTLDIAGETVQAQHVVIAVGAEPVRLGLPGEEHLVDNEGFLGLAALPARVVLVGGGYVAAEFSQVASRAGAEVTILQHGERMLKGFDADLVGWLMKSFDDAGIDVRLRSTVQAIDKQGDSYKVHATRDGQAFAIDADLVVHAAGRAPALEGLDLAAAHVATERGRLRLNEYLQSTSNPAVYAAGDAAQVGPPLTPVSSHDAKVVAANLLEGNHRKPDYRGVPSVAFTLPPIARVGLGEQQARDQGLRFELHTQEASDWFTARQASQPVYGHKVLVEHGTDRILGAHLAGPHADEVINLFALAIRHGLTAQDLKDTMFAYPTGASDVGYML